ncbi:hypothetical protein FACS189488_00590 [Betaproteobacteria bacterium]|nr:hypothetical protein FACS189488_00590 [Betaproteobacteria bacterium]
MIFTGLFLRGVPMGTNEKDTIVKFSIDPKNHHPFTDAQLAEIERLKLMSDDDINYNGAPPLGEDFWCAADRVQVKKTQVTIRLDDDVLDFFKHMGKRYQTRINSVLRAYVDAHLKQS